MRNLKINVFLYAFLVLLLAGMQEGIAQCAMCKQAATSSLEKNPNSIASGLNSGIIYLMLAPYLLLLFFFRKKIFRFLKEFYRFYKNPVS